MRTNLAILDYVIQQLKCINSRLSYSPPFKDSTGRDVVSISVDCYAYSCRYDRQSIYCADDHAIFDGGGLFRFEYSNPKFPDNLIGKIVKVLDMDPYGVYTEFQE